MGPGRAERREVEYSRRGTLTLIANCDVAQGTVVGPSLGPTRTEEDFVAHITRTVASDGEVARWHFVVDNLNIHQSACLVRFVAEHESLEEALGQKGKRGMLRSMATRSVSVRSTPSDCVPLHAETCFLDEPD